MSYSPFFINVAET